MMKSLSNEDNGTINSFNIGDTVRLCSGGPLLTVGAISESRSLINCLWFIDSNINSAWICPKLLRLDDDKDNDDYKVSWMDRAPVELYGEQLNEGFFDDEDDFDDCDEPDEGFDCDRVEETSDEDDEYREQLEEMTDYSDLLVRSKESGWFYDE